MKNNTIVEFDYLRGIAAWLIVLYHYTTRFQEVFNLGMDWKISFPFGCGCVYTFFLLSAFLTALNIEKYNSPLGFLKKRFLRLYPTYWVAIIITSITTYFFLPKMYRGLKTILINFTMLASIMGFDSVDGVYWTLVLELIFYVFIFAVLFARKQKSLGILAAIWLVTSIFLVELQRIPITGPILTIASALSKITLSKNCFPFVGGILLAEYYKRQKRIILIPVLLTVLYSFRASSFSYGSIYAISVFYMLIVLTSRGMAAYCRIIDLFQKTKMAKVLLWTASVSYPLYLVHQFIGWSVILKMMQFGFTGEWIVTIPLVIVLPLAFILNRYIEKPCLHLL